MWLITVDNCRKNGYFNFKATRGFDKSSERIKSSIFVFSNSRDVAAGNQRSYSKVRKLGERYTTVVSFPGSQAAENHMLIKSYRAEQLGLCFCISCDHISWKKCEGTLRFPKKKKTLLLLRFFKLSSIEIAQIIGQKLNITNLEKMWYLQIFSSGTLVSVFWTVFVICESHIKMYLIIYGVHLHLGRCKCTVKSAGNVHLTLNGYCWCLGIRFSQVNACIRLHEHAQRAAVCAKCTPITCHHGSILCYRYYCST